MSKEFKDERGKELVSPACPTCAATIIDAKYYCKKCPNNPKRRPL